MKKRLEKLRLSPMGAMAAILALSLILGGCGGGIYSAYDTAVAETAAAVPQRAYGMGYDAAAPMEAPALAMEEGIFEEDVALTSDSGGLTDSAAMNQAVSPSRKLIRNVSMSVETDTFDQLMEEIQKKVTELSGYIEHSDISGNRSTYSTRYAYLTARVPSDKLDQFIGLVEDSGNVTHKSESIQDITLQYSDLESRKKTLTMEQDRIWALLEKADTLEAVIALEERLSEIRYELESMESRLKLFDNEVEYSTIDISIDEVLPVDFTPTAPESVWQRIQKGFSRNVGNMGDFLTDLFIALIVLIPVWVPFAAVVAVAVILLRKSAKKRGKKKEKPSERMETEEEGKKAERDGQEEDAQKDLN